MYVPRTRGVGDVVPVPMSDWGFISPCQIAAANDAANAGDSGSSSTLGTWAWIAIIGAAVYATWGGK